MYDQSFFITEPVSNNAFHFEERKTRFGDKMAETARLNKAQVAGGPKIFVPALKEGIVEDVKMGDEIVFEDFDDEGILRSCKGLQCFIKVGLPNAAVYIFDNHNHAFTFWQLEKIKGNVEDGATLVHIDAHKDMRIPTSFLSPQEAKNKDSVFTYTNTVLNVGNFIPAAQKTGLVKEIFFIDSESSLEAFEVEKMRGKNLILDVDLDFFAPELDYIGNEKKAELVRKLLPLAKVVTFATSPFFIEQELAIFWLKKIFHESFPHPHAMSEV